MCLLITLLGTEGLHIKQFLISAFKGYTVLFSFLLLLFDYLLKISN